MKYSFIKDNDWVLIITTFLLTGFGLIMVFSASYALGLEDGFGNNPYYFIQRQLVWFALALLAFLFFLCIFRIVFFRKLSPLIILGSIVVLLLVLLVGVSARGPNGGLKSVHCGYSLPSL